MSSESTCLVNGHYKVINGMSPMVRVEDNVLSYKDYRLGEELKIEIQYGKVTTGVHMNISLNIFPQFEKADPKIGDVQYNVNFVFTFGGKTYEELGFITNDGLMVKIMGFMGYKTMEWVNEEEAAQIGKKLMANAKASPVILQYII